MYPGLFVLVCMTKNSAIQTYACLFVPLTQLRETGKSGLMLLSQICEYLLTLLFYISDPQS